MRAIKLNEKVIIIFLSFTKLAAKVTNKYEIRIKNNELFCTFAHKKRKIETIS
jgi:hypothetical protein